MLQPQWPNSIKNALLSCQQQTGLLLIEPAIELSTLSAGWSNQNFKLITCKQQFVLRVNSKQSNAICNRNNEVECWSIAEKAGLAPKLFWVSDDKQYYLSEYLPQPQNKQIQTAQLLNLLNRIKRLPLPTHAITTSDQWRSYFKQITTINNQLLLRKNKAQNAILLALTKTWLQAKDDLLNKKKQIESALTDIESCQIKPQFCHRDLNANNILIKDDQLVCIDFEYACTSHPLFELAAVICSHNFNKAEEASLVRDYLVNNSNLTENAHINLSSACKIFWCFFHCWAVIMMGNTLLSDTNELQGDEKETEKQNDEIEKSFNNYFQICEQYKNKFF
ncbi:hypothetical protein D5R81_08720 [Parashewanella spongiae]|uniref:Aminoglycoside phosphotransferase domain-containing protein n=1 Tax=Parashewanella spongiae TaxID=342950 RepID=A0A3A6U615_9GAMM|nr:phosphotransferase [Parashewanella spongiae]MCL1077961.1 phosphotransferase [Parashewanella spongiae]RJY16914.1 hypothetical protein D5R81_08720 [Parashewanella spongiae]